MEPLWWLFISNGITVILRCTGFPFIFIQLNFRILHIPNCPSFHLQPNFRKSHPTNMLRCFNFTLHWITLFRGHHVFNRCVLLNLSMCIFFGVIYLCLQMQNKNKKMESCNVNPNGKPIVKLSFIVEYLRGDCQTMCCEAESYLIYCSIICKIALVKEAFGLVRSMS